MTETQERQTGKREESRRDKERESQRERDKRTAFITSTCAD